MRVAINCKKFASNGSRQTEPQAKRMEERKRRAELATATNLPLLFALKKQTVDIDVIAALHNNLFKTEGRGGGLLCFR